MGRNYNGRSSMLCVETNCRSSRSFPSRYCEKHRAAIRQPSYELPDPEPEPTLCVVATCLMKSVPPSLYCAAHATGQITTPPANTPLGGPPTIQTNSGLANAWASDSAREKPKPRPEDYDRLGNYVRAGIAAGMSSREIAESIDRDGNRWLEQLQREQRPWISAPFEARMQAAIDNIRNLVNLGTPAGWTVTVSFSPGTNPTTSIARPGKPQEESPRQARTPPLVLGHPRGYFND